MKPGALFLLLAATLAALVVSTTLFASGAITTAVRGSLDAPAGEFARPVAVTPPARWWKGNTHCHTLWSDGDAAPSQVVHWYREQGWQFLTLSDHNIMLTGDAWFPVREDGRLTEARLSTLRGMFDSDWIQIQETDGVEFLRLHTLRELQQRFERPGEFLLIQGEEVTDQFEGRAAHINGLNLIELVEPQGGATFLETVQNDIDAIVAQGERLQRPVLAHVNHPNYGWAFEDPLDLARIRNDRFFEVYNGHSGVRNYGDATHPGLERMWDISLTYRLGEAELGLLYGLATDDAHNYHKMGLNRQNPGRGWVMVRAAALEAGALLAAMHAGDFYASSGVTLDDVRVEGGVFTVEIAAEQGLDYTTEFIGTRRNEAGFGPTGEVLLSTSANPAVYRFTGDELYVRAKLTSSRDHPNPYARGDKESAWVQPVVPKGR